MNFIQLPKPHGYLIWKGKQKAIASPIPIIHDRFLTLISEGEAYGDLALAQPAKVNISELERLESDHCLRPEERKLYYPDATIFYIHHIKEWRPYEATKAVHINGNSFEYLDYYPTSEEFEILNKAERLPKTIPLFDEAVVLEGDKAIIKDGLDRSKIEPVLKAVLEDAKLVDASLPLYQLALVRIPRLLFKEKKSEGEMPYKMVNNHPGCKDSGKKVGVINKATGKLEGCSENEAMAKEHMAALYAAEKKEAGVGEGEKCDMPMMAESPMMAGPTSFAEMMALEAAQEAASETNELTHHFQMIAGNIMASDLITDKAAALAKLADEYAGLVQQAMSGDEMKGEDEVSEADKAYDADGYKATWTAKYVNSLPNSSFLYVEPNCDTTACRHLPYADANGKVDLPHLRAAASRLGQSGTGSTGGERWLTPDLRKKLQNKVSKLLEDNKKGAEDIGEETKVGKRMAGTMVEKLKQMLKMMQEVMGWAEHQDEDMSKGFAIKQIDGKPWLVTYSTNAFKDREKEIFSTKSLEKYVEAAEKQSDKGYYNLWHIPDTDIAKIEWQGVVGRFLVEAGPFLDTPVGQAAAKFFKDNPDGHKELAPEGWGCSPEYRYLPEERETGVYENIWKTKTSILPRMAAANIWTKTEVKMALSEQQKGALAKIVGDDLATKIIGGAEGATKELEEAGVAHKGEAETPAPTEEAKPDFEAILATQLQPFVEAMNILAEQQTKLETLISDVSGRVKSLEKTEEIKSKTETPRALLFTQWASQAEKTAVAEDDPLTKMKPVETAHQDKSGAAAFFPARK